MTRQRQPAVREYTRVFHCLSYAKHRHGCPAGCGPSLPRFPAIFAPPSLPHSGGSGKALGDSSSLKGASPTLVSILQQASAPNSRRTRYIAQGFPAETGISWIHSESGEGDGLAEADFGPFATKSKTNAASPADVADRFETHSFNIFHARDPDNANCRLPLFSFPTHSNAWGYPNCQPLSIKIFSIPST